MSRINSEAQRGLQKQENASTIAKLLEKMKPQMSHALPAHMTADRMCRIALTEFRKTPALADCDPMSFVGSVMICASLGLEIGALGQAYLIPYKRECTFILGYKGMIDLARRSGQIISIAAHCVYEKDFFEYEYGLEDKLSHKPALGARGSMIAVYAVAKLKGGGYQFEVMSKEDIDNIRNTKSRGGNYGPWKTDFDEMARKTVIRRLFKYLPCSVEMSKAISYEEQSEVGVKPIELAAEDYDLGEEITGSASTIHVEAEATSQVDKIAEQLAGGGS